MRANQPLLTVLASVALLNACAGADDDAAGGAAADTSAQAASGPAAELTSIADVGFATPESVLHDEQADVYLVSNINGTPVDRDNNGFIARVRPTGEVEQLKWIEGGRNGVTLHAPKGMGLHGDTLFVSDIDTVRAFHRTSGAALGGRGVRGASFLNDIAVDPDGTLYVTDTGVDASFASTGREAVYRFGADSVVAVASGAALMGPNGVLADAAGVVVVPFGGNTVMRLPAAGGAPITLATLPAGQLDGVVRASDGSLLVSSWEAQAVYRVATDGQVSTAVANVESPADIGWDARRHRLLIPLFSQNRIEVRVIH